METQLNIALGEEKPITEPSSPVIPARKYYLIGLLVLSVIALAITALYFKGNNIATQVVVYSFCIAYTAYAVAYKDTQVMRFLLFGLCTGFAELLADSWAVVSAETLFYPTNQPMLFSTPLYMPFAWAMVFIKVGYVGFFIGKRKNLALTMLIMLFVGGIFVPMCEYVTIKAGWWYYAPARLNVATIIPWYVIATEGIAMAFSPWFFLKSETSKWKYIPLLAVGQGLIVFVTLYITYNALK